MHAKSEICHLYSVNIGATVLIEVEQCGHDTLRYFNSKNKLDASFRFQYQIKKTPTSVYVTLSGWKSIYCSLSLVNFLS